MFACMLLHPVPSEEGEDTPNVCLGPAPSLQSQSPPNRVCRRPPAACSHSVGGDGVQWHRQKSLVVFPLQRELWRLLVWPSIRRKRMTRALGLDGGMVKHEL